MVAMCRPIDSSANIVVSELVMEGPQKVINSASIFNSGYTMEPAEELFFLQTFQVPISGSNCYIFANKLTKNKAIDKRQLKD